LQVKDVMTPLSQLDAVDYRSLAAASDGDVVAALLKFAHPYLIVIEASTVESPARVRGLVSQA